MTTLIIFAASVIPLSLLGLVGLWLLAHEYWLTAIFTLVFAKLAGVGITRDILGGNGEGWAARRLHLIARFRCSVHEAR